MPKNRKEALEEFFRKAGARTESERRQLLEKLGWKVRLREGRTEVVKSGAGGTQMVRRTDEVTVKPELAALRDRVIADAESEESGAPTAEPAARQGGANGA